MTTSQPYDFAQRLHAMVDELREGTGMRVTAAKIGPPCPQTEIDKVHRKLGYELSEEFLAYYRSANGVLVRWTNSRLNKSGGIKLHPLRKIFLSSPGGIFMPDLDSRKIDFLGGMDERELRQGMRIFDEARQDPAQQGYPGVALYCSSARRDPVLIFPEDAAACIDGYHPMLARSYMEMLLVTAGEQNSIREWFGWGFGGEKALIQWDRADWSRLGSAGRYLRWLLYRGNRRSSWGPGEENLLRGKNGAAELGPVRWIELRHGANYPAPPDQCRDSAAEPEMIAIPGGSFFMGSPKTEGGLPDEQPQHETTVAPFAMAKHPVTQRRYFEVMGGWPKYFVYFQGEGPPAPEAVDHPVPGATWYDAVLFCNRLSERAGLRPAYRIKGNQVEWERSANGYRLPTEREWEYAARAGTTTAFHFGEDQALLPEYSWFAPKEQNWRHPVGMKNPNPFGLHDLWHVREWCWDAPWSYEDGQPLREGKGRRVTRGGIEGYDDWKFLRSAKRNSERADYGHWAIGFRVVRSLAQAT